MPNEAVLPLVRTEVVDTRARSPPSTPVSAALTTDMLKALMVQVDVDGAPDGSRQRLAEELASTVTL